MATHTEEQVERGVQALKKIFKEEGIIKQKFLLIDIFVTEIEKKVVCYYAIFFFFYVHFFEIQVFLITLIRIFCSAFTFDSDLANANF